MKYVEAASLFTFLFFDLDPDEVSNRVKERLPSSVRRPLSSIQKLLGAKV